MKTTLDGLLNQRVKLEQPAKGYRVAIDTVLLAAAVPAKAGDRVLDLGCGVGGTMLCLAARVPGLSITGIEIQPDLAELCRRNIARNAFDAKMDVIEGDLTKMDLSGFDHVMMNPPYYEEGTHDVSPHQGKRIANAWKGKDLALSVMTEAVILPVIVSHTLIHLASRTEEIVSVMRPLFEEVVVLPIVPRAGDLPGRVLIRGQKRGDRNGLPSFYRRCKPFILHGKEGGFIPTAENVIRHMNPIEFIVESEEEMT